MVSTPLTSFALDPFPSDATPEPLNIAQNGKKELGVLGIFTNVVACVHLAIIIFFIFWPPACQTTASTMNYSVPMNGAVLCFSILFYFGYARNVYTVPVVKGG